MDWQTKEELDSRFDSIEDSLQAIKEKLGIEDEEINEELGEEINEERIGEKNEQKNLPDNQLLDENEDDED